MTQRRSAKLKASPDSQRRVTQNPHVRSAIHDDSIVYEQ